MPYRLQDLHGSLEVAKVELFLLLHYLCIFVTLPKL